MRCLLVGAVPTVSLIVPAVAHPCDPLQKSRASYNGRGVRRMRGRAWCPQTWLQRVGASHRRRSPPASVNTFFLRNVERFDSQTAGRDLMPKMWPAPMAIIIQARAPLMRVARDAAPQGGGQCLSYLPPLNAHLVPGLSERGNATHCIGKAHEERMNLLPTHCASWVPTSQDRSLQGACKGN